jgi:hypothetical protein
MSSVLTVYTFLFYGIVLSGCPLSELIWSSWSDSLDGGSAIRKVATYTRQHKHREYTGIYASSAIRTHDQRGTSVRADEDSSCLRLNCHCDRHISYLILISPI